MDARASRQHHARVRVLTQIQKLDDALPMLDQLSSAFDRGGYDGTPSTDKER